MHGLVAPQPIRSSRTRDRTHVSCPGRWILNHLATWEVPPSCVSTTESWATRGCPRWTNLRLCSRSVSRDPPLLLSETKKSWAPDTPNLLGGGELSCTPSRNRTKAGAWGPLSIRLISCDVICMYNLKKNDADESIHKTERDPQTENQLEVIRGVKRGGVGVN